MHINIAIVVLSRQVEFGSGPGCVWSKMLMVNSNHDYDGPSSTTCNIRPAGMCIGIV